MCVCGAVAIVSTVVRFDRLRMSRTHTYIYTNKYTYSLTPTHTNSYARKHTDRKADRVIEICSPSKAS